MKILIVDDHRLMIEGIRAALEDVADMEVVGEAHSGSEVAPLVARLAPDLVLLDIRLPQIDGFTVMDILRQRFPDVKIVVLSVLSDAAYVNAALSRGASGYIVKSIDPGDLAGALRQIIEGTVFHSIGGEQQKEDPTLKEAGLTRREMTILRAVARGLSNKAIARELGVSEQTVKFHLTRIYRKLDVANRTEAARLAFRLGLDRTPLVLAVVAGAITLAGRFLGVTAGALGSR